jgi:EAL domain-containing protein (putative c-di-GMP-specific phosphodiesterase class I)
LELTESLLIQDSSTISALLHRLRGRGVSFSIDDFGMGYSNLGYLKRFDVSRLKIDQSFIRRLTDDKHDEAIVRAIIQMTTSLQLVTIAEGVESESTLARLVELGCHEGQGLHWAPALPSAEFLEFATKRRSMRGIPSGPEAAATSRKRSSASARSGAVQLCATALHAAGVKIERVRSDQEPATVPES